MLFNLTQASVDDIYGDALFSLAAAKAHLRVDAADEDALIKALRNAAIDMVQRCAGVRLSFTTGMVAAFDKFGEGMRPGIGPAATIAVTAVSYIDSSGASVAMSAADWRVGVDGRLLPAIGKEWPAASGPVTVTFSAGFAPGQCPPALMAAVRLMLGHLYVNREAVSIGGTYAEMPLGVQTLCDQYRPSVI